MRSARMRTKDDYHYWLGIAIVAVALLWSFVDANAEAIAPVQGVPNAPSAYASHDSHPFMSKGNLALWAADGAAKAFDGAATGRVMSGPGAVEHDPIARPFVTNTPGQIAYFSASLAGDIAISYLFHKTGHHKLEKVVMLIGIGNSAACAGYSSTHYIPADQR